MRSHDYYRNIIHPVIALVLPASFLFSLTTLLPALIIKVIDLPAGFLPDWHGALLPLSLLSGLIAVIFGNIFQRERVRWTARLREWMFLSLVVYALVSLFKDGPLSSRYMPSLSNVLAILYASFQWFASVRIQNALRDREILALELEGKEGDDLYASMRDAGVQPVAAQQSLEWLRGLSTSFAVTLLLLLLLIGSNDVRLPVLTILSVMQYFWVYLCILVLCSQYGFEQYAAGAGLREKDSQRAGRLRFAFMIILLTGGVAFLFGGLSALVPTAWIGALFARFGLWLKSLIPGGGILIKTESQSDAPPGEGIRELIAYGDQGADLTAFIEALSRCVPVALIILVALFLLAPLLSKRYRVMLARHSVMDFVREVVAHLRAMLSKKSGIEEGRALIDSDNLHEVRKRLSDMARPHTDKSRRNEFGRVCRSFLRLIRWGKRKGIDFTSATAPGTYTRLLSERFPAHKETLAVIADCFEQAVYSTHQLGKERLVEYERAVRTVVQDK